jgi:RNA polymerase sigma-70 factor (ECF subfamily)
VSEVGPQLDGLFRRQSARLVARLARRFGTQHFELAEDVVQDALLRAQRHWSIHGLPQDPSAWLARVAHNLALDRLRRDARIEALVPELEAHPLAFEPCEPPDPDALDDDELAMMFACCHPSLPQDARVALTLKAVAGFGVPEIARAFLEPEPTTAQRLVRAKARLCDEQIAIEVPAQHELGARLDAVLTVVYLVLNEGLAAHRGEHWIRHDLVRTALRLSSRLALHPETSTPRTDALAALAHFHAARLASRLDDNGSVLLLSEQDRSRWDHKLLAIGFAHLRRAMAGDEPSELHLEAGIASEHARARTWAETDWPAILHWYDLLLARRDTPIARLNRAVALAEVEGPGAALLEIERIASERALADYHLLEAIRGDLCERVGRVDEALIWYRSARESCRSGPERALLERRIARLGPERSSDRA